jgi:hypothetical protein
MEHPAHRLAGTAADAAEELRGYLAPVAGLPWELSRADHRDLVPRLYGAVSCLAECIGFIAQATPGEDAKRQLTEAARTILRGCQRAQAAVSMLGGERPDPGAATPPPQLAASDFPQPMTGDLLQAASARPAPATPATPGSASRQVARGMPGRAAAQAALRIGSPPR